ncbi:MAG: hypothetical protein H0T91_10810 [Propionibacteriaceae bacterium]|nr:hypothetical protein [Propionibacteriaceae bacterium]
MTLTLGTGPLSATTDGTLHPPGADGGPAFVQPYPRRVRALVGGRTVLDSEHGVMLHRRGGLPTFWVPAADVDRETLADRHAVQTPSLGGALAEALRDLVHLRFEAADRCSWRTIPCTRTSGTPTTVSTCSAPPGMSWCGTAELW